MKRCIRHWLRREAQKLFCICDSYRGGAGLKEGGKGGGGEGCGNAACERYPCCDRLYPRRLYAIGMKKQYVTKVAACAAALPAIIVSGGRLGSQIELQPENLLKAARAEYADICVR